MIADFNAGKFTAINGLLLTEPVVVIPAQVSAVELLY